MAVLSVNTPDGGAEKRGRNGGKVPEKRQETPAGEEAGGWFEYESKTPLYGSLRGQAEQLPSAGMRRWLAPGRG